MASIYESPGQQVALTGSQTSPSFQPGTAYDPSRQMLQQSERDLTAFAQFSDTLNKFITDKAKEKNEQELQLGIADIVNGDMTPSADAYAKYQQDVAVLKTGAEEDTRIGNTLSEQGDLAVGQQFKADSKAVSGWRAYGRAVGSAKMVASNAQGFMATWMETKDPILQTRDGRLISPAEASTPEDIQAALAMGQQALIRQSNIQGINPMIIAEHLAPTLQAVRGQMFSNKLTAEVAKQKRTAISDLKGEIRGVFSNPDLTSDEMFVDYQQFVTNLEVYGDLARGDANDLAIQEALATIKTMPPIQAREMLQRLGDVRKIANDPNSITLGLAYGSDFDETLAAIDGKQETYNRKIEEQEAKAVETAVTLLKAARLDPNTDPAQLKQQTDVVMDMLSQAAKTGNKEALRLQTEFLAEPTNVDYRLYHQYRAGIAQGKRPSDTQIEADVAAGRLTTEMGKELKQWVVTEIDTGFKKQFGSSIEDAVKAKLIEAGTIDINPYTNKPDKNPLHVQQITNDLTRNALAWFKIQKEKGENPDDNDVNQYVLNQLPKTIGKYFRQDPKTKTWTPLPLSNNPELTPARMNSALGGYVPDAAGFNPRTIQLRNLNSGSARLLSAEEVTESVERLKAGQPVAARIQTLANSTLGGLPALLQQQSVHNKLDPKVVQGLPFAQQNSQYAAIAPWATRRLNATGGNYLQQTLQLQRIQQAQLRRQRMESSAGMAPVTDLRPGVKIGMREYLQLGLQNGLSKEEAIEMAAVGMAESTGNSGVRNTNPNTGDDSYGLWQINMIGNLGPDRLRRYGLRSADDLKDPETNARVMAAMLRTDGKTAWGAYKDKRYLQYMSEARRMFADVSGGGAIVPASHPNSGNGFTIPNTKDASGRPPIFSQGGAKAFAKMMADSGGVVKASDIASSQRSESKNRNVGGAMASEHLSGNAIDIHGPSGEWMKKNGPKYGWYLNEYDGSHGGHFEYRGS